MKGLVLGPGVVRTPSLIAHVIVNLLREQQAITALSAPSPPLREDEHCWLVASPASWRGWHIVQLSRSPQLRIRFLLSQTGRRSYRDL